MAAAAPGTSRGKPRSVPQPSVASVLDSEDSSEDLHELNCSIRAVEGSEVGLLEQLWQKW